MLLHFHGSHIRKRISTSTSLAFVTFFIALSLAAANTVWAIYLYRFGLSDSTVGLISAFFLVVSLVTSFFIIPILEKHNLKKLIIVNLLILIGGYIAIAFVSNLYFFLSIILIFSIATPLRISAIDINFRDNTEDENLNKQMGLLYTLLNIAWLIGPLIAGFFLVEFGIQTVFLSVALFYSLSFFLFLLIKSQNQAKRRDKLDIHIFQNIKYYIRDKGLVDAYIVSVGLQIWWSLIYIYMPLFIISRGLGEGTVSIFFALIIVPLILIEYLVGKLSKEKGFKIFFVTGFFSLAVISLILFVVNNIHIEIIIAIIASFFAALIEPLQNTFFFKKVKKLDEEKFYPLFTTAIYTGGIIGKILPAIGLLFLPDRYAYLIIGALMFGLFLYTRKIKEVSQPFKHIPSVLDYSGLPHRLIPHRR